ncbi:MAG: carbonic anhydrase [Alistipes sp.]
MNKLYVIVCVAVLICGCKSSVNKIQNREHDNITIQTPEQAIEALKAGNDRFVTGTNQRLNLNRLKETVAAQHPFAVVVGCSDSRVPVELIFDQGIGDLFVIRTAGNSVNGEILMGSLDYSIDHLGVKAVVVLGHQNCGGIHGAITTEDQEDHPHKSNVGNLLEILRKDVSEYVGCENCLDKAIKQNIEKQIERIRSVDYIAKLIEEGKIAVVGANYNIESGEIIFYD